MTDPQAQLLVSVRSASEAHRAIAGGAHVIDVKEPTRGPLGMADTPVIEAVRDLTHERITLSIALGELADEPPTPLPRGVDFVKAGLARAPTDWRGQLSRLFERVAPAAGIAVAYADYQRANAPAPGEVFDWAYEHQAAGVLVDTAVKGGGGLFDWVDEATLRHWIDTAHSAGLIVALAGSLQDDGLTQAAALGADIVAVRGVACRDGDREGEIDTDKVRRLVGLIATRSGSEAAPVS